MLGGARAQLISQNPARRGSAAERRPPGRCNGPALAQETEAEVSERQSPPEDGRGAADPESMRSPAVGTTGPLPGEAAGLQMNSPATMWVLPSSYSLILQICSAAGERVMESDGGQMPLQPPNELIRAGRHGLGSLGPSLDSPQTSPRRYLGDAC